MSRRFQNLRLHIQVRYIKESPILSISGNKLAVYNNYMLISTVTLMCGALMTAMLGKLMS